MMNVQPFVKLRSILAIIVVIEWQWSINKVVDVEKTNKRPMMVQSKRGRVRTTGPASFT